MTYILPKGQTLFYASAKFRELQIDQILNDRPKIDFPTNKNFFLTSKHSVAIAYSALHDDPVKYFHPTVDIDRIKKQFNVTHVYNASKQLKLFRLMEKENIDNLLFKDPNSPFHYSKAGIKVHNIYEIKTKINAKRTQYADIEKKTGLGINDIEDSAFSLLLVATKYLEVPQGVSRYSTTSIDYILYDLFKKHLESDFDGVYQDNIDDFHEEICIFNPSSSLTPDYKHKYSWFNNKQVQALTVKPKQQYDFVKQWKDKESKKIAKEIKEFEEILASGENSEEFLEYQEDYEGTFEDFQKTYQVNINKLKSDNLDPVSNIVKIASSLNKDRLHRGSNKTQVIQKYVNKKSGRCRLDNCKNPVSFENCQIELKKIADEMRLYPNANNLHHRGATVADHSIWAARTAYNWMGYIDDPWTKDIYPELRNTVLLSAFLHDIGKIGDLDQVSLTTKGKDDHTYKGLMYIMDQIEFRALTDTSLQSIFNSCYVKDIHKVIIGLCVAMHHYLGLLLSVNNLTPYDAGHSMNKIKWPSIMKDNLRRLSLLNSSSILAKLLTNIVEFKYIITYYDFMRFYRILTYSLPEDDDTIEQILRIIITVSACDVYGAHNVKIDKSLSIYNDDVSALLDPHILHTQTNQHPPMENYIPASRPYYKYLYYTLGLEERDKLLAYSKIVNKNAFMDAWDTYHLFLKHIESKVNLELPRVYRYLDMSGVQEFVTSLFRLLKVGELPTVKHYHKKVPDEIRTFLRTEYNDNDKTHASFVKLYKTHRHKSFEI